MDKETLSDLRQTAVQVRKDLIEMIYSANGGNTGAALSAVEMLTLLIFDIMNIRPEDPMWEGRDKLILSKGQAAPAYYSAMSHRGYFDPDELTTFRKFNSRLQTHPEYGKLPGVEFSSGSLGQGLSAAVGMALACRYLNKRRQIFVILGDGEIQEGQVWEAAMSASHYDLSEITAVIDHNSVQAEGPLETIMDIEPVADKWSAFGWNVKTADGHSFTDMRLKFDELHTDNRPGLLLAETVKGKGISFMEGSVRWHLGQGMTSQEFNSALDELKQHELSISRNN